MPLGAAAPQPVPALLPLQDLDLRARAHALLERHAQVLGHRADDLLVLAVEGEPVVLVVHLERAVRRDSVPSVSTLRKRDLSGSSSGKSETSQGPLSCVDRLYFPRLSRTLGGGQLLTTIRI